MVLLKLDQFTRATSVQKLSAMVAELESVPAQLRSVQRKTAFLRTKAEDLNAGMIILSSLNQMSRFYGNQFRLVFEFFISRMYINMTSPGLRQVRSSLLRTLATCKERPCVQLQEKHQIGQLDTEIQYNKVL